MWETGEIERWRDIFHLCFFASIDRVHRESTEMWETREIERDGEIFFYLCFFNWCVRTEYMQQKDNTIVYMVYRNDVHDWLWTICKTLHGQIDIKWPKNSPAGCFRAQPNVLFDMCLICIVLHLYLFKNSKTYLRIGFFRKLPYPYPSDTDTHIRIRAA